MYNLLFHKVFTFKGRSSRKEYITKVLLLTVCIITWVYTIDLYGNEDSLFSFLYVTILFVCEIVLFFQYFPLTVRRLHDLNENGWYVLITFLPFGQLLILWLMFIKGTPGHNKYGEPPSD